MPAYGAEPSGNGGRTQGILTATFLVLALVLLNLPTEGQRVLQAAMRASVLRPFVWTQETLLEARVLATATASLRDSLAAAAAVSVSRTHLMEENRRLRALLSISERIGPSWVAASVIRAGTMGSESVFQLNVGAVHGVEVNTPIITRQGLVGLVREVGPESAVGMDWTHPEFRASAMDSAGVVYGLVEARRGTFREEDRLQFTGTAFTARIGLGTPVLTSGLGGVYPRGIPVGRVTGVAEEEAGWRRSYWLEPMVEPGSVTHVLVARGPRDPGEDLSEFWPADSMRTDPELRRLEESRVDSLGLLRDSVARLRERIRELVPPPDTGGVSVPSRGSEPSGGSGRSPSEPGAGSAAPRVGGYP